MTVFPYKDASLPVDDRVEDLLSRLSLEEKAGLMFHMMLTGVALDVEDRKFMLPAAQTHIDAGLSHFNIMGGFDTAREFAEWSNSLQAAALQKRWGIPVTLSTDPRHAFNDNPQTGLSSRCFSQWPEHVGFAAIRDPARIEKFADVVRQEYLAVGIRAALHPQADLATEPRWSRTAGSLGEDADIASKLCAAHIRGLQGKDFGPASITACVKHFPGGGPEKDGYDPHFSWGAEQVYPGGKAMWDYHLRPFRAAIAEGVRVVMPSYGKPMGTEYEPIGMAFNKPIIQGILREELAFEGVVVTDWAIIKDLDFKEQLGDLATARAWGVEHLTPEERVIKCLDAGCDQFGGEHDVSLLIAVVKNGRVPESRLDVSVRRLLRDKFALGLFEHSYVDVNAAELVVGSKPFREAGIAAQKDAVTLLKNDTPSGRNTPLLPLSPGTKVFLEGFRTSPDEALANHRAVVVQDPSTADVAIVRLSAPWTPVGNGAFANHFHHGSLEFKPEILARVAELAKVVPVVVEVFADRPAVLGSLDTDATALMVSFGISAPALVDVLFGYSPQGRLPFDMPRSDAAVEASRTDTPFDTADPFYRFGHGLRYTPKSQI